MNRLSFRLQVEELTARILPSATPLLVPAPNPQALVQTDDHHDSRFGRFNSEAELRNYLIDQAVQQYSWYFGRTMYPYYYWMLTPRILATSDAALMSTTNGTPQHSDTNTQVAGVDEGDFVETDGKYLYVLTNNKLVILDARHAANLKELSETELSGNCVAEYLDGNRLTVISMEYNWWGGRNSIYEDASARADIAFYPWWGYWSKPEVKVTVFDVSDPNSPTVVQETRIDGSYEDSRAIDGTVYVAVNNSANYPMPLYTIDDTEKDGTVKVAGSSIAYDRLTGPTITYESEASYRARLEAMPLSELLPSYTTTWSDGNGTHEQTGPISDPKDVCKPTGQYAYNLTTLLAFDMNGHHAGPVDSLSLFTSYGTTLYASQNNFYLLTQQWTNDGTVTHIDKLSVHDGRIGFEASGDVPGYVVNQFSMSENGRYFYIATTESWGSNASNRVYVLTQHGHSLDTIGKTDDLTHGESIYSVQFIGDRAFVSTFRRIDPLFAIDLSDPTAPRVAGQLEMTGYNSYLQAIDATHLIGIGQDVDPVTGRVTDFQISLFDVSDLSHPKLVSHYVTAELDRWSWSSAAYDHHALTYDSDLGALTLTVSGWSTEDWHYESSQLVFQIDVAHNSMKFKGEVTDAATITRGVFIGNTLYSISAASVQAHDLNDLKKLVARVELPAPSYYFYPIRWWPVLIMHVEVATGVVTGTEESSGTKESSETPKVIANPVDTALPRPVLVTSASNSSGTGSTGSTSTVVTATGSSGVASTGSTATSVAEEHNQPAATSHAAAIKTDGNSSRGGGESTHADAASDGGGNPTKTPEAPKPQQDGSDTSAAPATMAEPETVGELAVPSDAILTRADDDFRLWAAALAVVLAPGLAELAPAGVATQEPRRQRAGIRR